MNVIAWKNVWGALLNDTEMRRYMVGRDDMGFIDATVTGSAVKLSGTLGTVGSLYIVDTDPSQDGLGHFVAYEVHSGAILVFDPAKSGGLYGEWFNKDVVDAMEKKFRKPVTILDIHPQIWDWDSFCQTWSLAYLMNIPLAKVNGQNARSELHKIVHVIARNPKFERYVHANKSLIQTWIRDEDPRGATVKDFVTFSQTISLAQFKRL